MARKQEFACGCRKSGANARRRLSSGGLAGDPAPHVLIAADGTRTEYPTREEAYEANRLSGYKGIVRKA